MRVIEIFWMTRQRNDNEWYTESIRDRRGGKYSHVSGDSTPWQWLLCDGSHLRPIFSCSAEKILFWLSLGSFNVRLKTAQTSEYNMDRNINIFLKIIGVLHWVQINLAAKSFECKLFFSCLCPWQGGENWLYFHKKWSRICFIFLFRIE